MKNNKNNLGWLKIKLGKYLVTKWTLLKRIETLNEENNELKKQLQEFSSIDQNWEEYKKKSDLIDMLGETYQIEKLIEYGTLDGIFKRLDEGELLKEKNEKLERENAKLIEKIDEDLENKISSEKIPNMEEKISRNI